MVGSLRTGNANDAAALADEYLAAAKRSADLVHDFRRCQRQQGDTSKSLEILDGRAFVIPSVLSTEECDALITETEEFGIIPNRKFGGSGRSAKRTDKYTNEQLSHLVASRIRKDLVSKLIDENESSSSYGQFAGLHFNWRVLRYDPGDTFPAHQDQMDTIQQVNKNNGTKDMLISSHTLLINLSRDEEVEGGATRFYPHAKIRGTTPGQYDYAIDVLLPRGWALVFQQKGLVHCGQPVFSGHKYVAQVGVLRELPKGKLVQPSIFRLGPGVEDSLAS